MPTLDGDIRVSKQGLKRARRQLVQLEDSIAQAAVDVGLEADVPTAKESITIS